MIYPYGHSIISVSLLVALVAVQVEGMVVVDFISERAGSERLILWWDDAVTSAAMVVE